jgi:nitroimidazol reductase NimA-like FMN-containing flavoprotein (pyridoxamine 5'-phosphate oxidase superfamily)
MFLSCSEMKFSVHGECSSCLLSLSARTTDASVCFTKPLQSIYYLDMTFPQTNRTNLKRLPKRGHFDRETVYGILDEGFICHVGFVVDAQPFVIPTGYARVGDKLYIHGSQASRMLRSLANGVDACVTVTIVDGLVLARSAFHHSINYRSVVVFGRATLVEDRDEKSAALFAFSEQIVKGRWNDVREPSEAELKQTSVLCLPLLEASAKVRTGPPIDDEEDYAMPVWAGVIPLRLAADQPIADPRLPQDVPAPEYAKNYKRG